MENLVKALEADLEPIKPLSSPSRRLLTWLAIGIPAVAGVVLASGFRSDISVKLADPAFLSQQATMLATAVLAGWVAMAATVPGTRRWVLFLPFVGLFAWIAAMGQQCWDDWMRMGIDGLMLSIDLRCIPGIAATGIVPAVAMVVMLRRGASFQSLAAIGWGTLAAAALANSGLRLFHTVDAGMMLLVWQFGTVVAFTLIATLFKDSLLPMRRWVQSAD